MMQSVEKWCPFEVAVSGKTQGNPFTDYTVQGVFQGKNQRVTVDGFYDGGGVYKLRFMPAFEGEYTYEISGSFSEEVTTGCFLVTPAKPDNHGPLRVVNRYHFAYEDGTPYYSVGTTCYVWTHQSEALRRQTLEELKKGYFNKIRFCIFPKHYIFNFKDPETYPYEGTPMDSSILTKENFFQYARETDPGNQWDFTRFQPAHFQRIESYIAQLMELGIEADLIVMHPYDRWGFSAMPKEADDLYWKYVIARFAAYRNVWWSLANEYDLMPAKKLEDWERYGAILCEKDPYGHLRSIHNCGEFYDYSRPWITHASIQRQDIHKTAEYTDDWRVRFGKPVVLDEIAYEGNIDHCWGNISGQELTRRFWEAAIRGGYAGHGETYMHPEEILWWSHGGKLHGDSPARIRFLHKILSETPGYGLKQHKGFTPPFTWDDVGAVPEDRAYAGHYYLLYFGKFRPAFREYSFPDDALYTAEVIDTWEMTITSLGTFRKKIHIPLPGKEYMAIRIRKADGE